MPDPLVSDPSAGEEQKIEPHNEPDVVQGPVLLPVGDRRVLVVPREGPECSSLYAFMREWVRNPASITSAIASRNNQAALERVPKLIPGTPFEPDQVTDVQVTIPDIESHVENPTLETHLPRWKALGKKRRLEYEKKKALGFERLYKRLHAQGLKVPSCD